VLRPVVSSSGFVSCLASADGGLSVLTVGESPPGMVHCHRLAAELNNLLGQTNMGTSPQHILRMNYPPAA
jgi:hypothetical protein